MSRKHFIQIAQIILSAKNDAETPEAQTSLDNVARDLASVCAQTNSHFDRSRFLRACGVAA